jgi:hypothetical protein
VDDLETLLETRRGSSGTANLSAKEFKELLNKITGDKVILAAGVIGVILPDPDPTFLPQNLAMFANLNFKVVTPCVIKKTMFH